MNRGGGRKTDMARVATAEEIKLLTTYDPPPTSRKK